MNLKERGITVGDLLIILIIIITSTILIKSFSKDKKTTLNYSNQEQVSYKEKKIAMSYTKKEVICSKKQWVQEFESF